MLTTEQKVQRFDKMLADRKKYHSKRNIKISLMLAKAVGASIIVTQAEVDAEVKRRLALKK